ncbi:MAG: response regulator, partial [Candidatus Hydrogenedentes bacterium]|nr:response regulator [Candidatus Hydrogenedentota bacterium]
GGACVGASAAESVERAEKERPDAVLMDIRLRDEMDGIEAADQIHTRFGIPVVFLSAHRDHMLLERAKRVGSFGYLVKPFEEDELYATLEMALYKAKADMSMLAASRMEATATLAGGIAHDYNNLMSVVLGYAEHVRGELGKDHPNAGMLMEIEGAARKASDLAEGLLAFARGGAHKLGKMDLNQTVSEMLRAAEKNLPRRIGITCDFAEDLWSIEADRSQLNLVLTGLLANAIEAIEGEGKIDITTRNVDVIDTVTDKGFVVKIGRYTVLNIKDTGCGMNEEILGKVFEPFFSTKFQGRGLGLASVYGIVKNHGGYIVMESKENEGASCTIYFPVLHVEADESVEPQGVKKAAGDETILVVDDEEILLKMTSVMLSRLGYKVLTANGGQTAQDLLRDHEGDVHLVLLDMNMGGMDGPTLFPHLKRERPEMKVLLFSGYEMDETVQGLLDAGANGFLKKPVSSKKLGAEIRRMLDA